MLVSRTNLMNAAVVCPEQCLNFARFYGALMEAEKKSAYTRALYKSGDVNLDVLEASKKNVSQKCAMAVNKLLAWNTSFNRKSKKNFVGNIDSLSLTEVKNVMSTVAQIMGVNEVAQVA